MDRCKWRKVINEVHWPGWMWAGECFFWYRPTQVVPDKRPLNGCCCSINTVLLDMTYLWPHRCASFLNLKIVLLITYVYLMVVLYLRLSLCDAFLSMSCCVVIPLFGSWAGMSTAATIAHSSCIFVALYKHCSSCNHIGREWKGL